MAKISDGFLAIIGGLLELYGQQASTTKINIYWSTLSQYPIDSLRRAANVWVRKSEFMPKPADLINLMGGPNNHLSPDEAWAIAILASDETNTLVWTKEIAKAWAQAELVYRNGDKIGARRTFIEAYGRLVNSSMMNGKNVEVFVSLGSDKTKRADAINRAVFIGLLTPEKANCYLPKPENTIAMLEFKDDQVSAKSMEHIANIKEMLKKSRTCIKAN
ncbi:MULTISPECIES: hypothetical protein [unclassified Gilliamella]|uniref:hypothetical protein n=1 Tax=unclassified Gilliamella TaxID=2685620 RepID=UPI00226ABC8C|nr:MULTISPECIES: hypothetical protein [unclassified Gilliamella]MCX8597576.1 hypothetical protein [Gilliamella sp. B3493]MCX8598564.1 hypothetical protein [Gilliamella sp. B3486]MCX8659596.1 hypothetical protein [Gilliamella sp. B2772]MCX8682439.1 hypothetical protein [Gilliamella sp. B2889]MCX8688353.1 hypothetical protein [Gilliamella sp. B2973]